MWSACASSLLFLFLAAEPYAWNLPKGFPQPRVPTDNPMSAEKAELGRYLFYDKRLSVNGTQSCASCHRQELAFTDGRAHGIGATGQPHPRGAMSLVNVAYSALLTWSDPESKSLEAQALVPMFGEHPVELGLIRETVPAILRADPVYRRVFPQAFPGEPDPFTVANATRAIASFERTIVSARSPYDRYHYGGDDSAVSPSVRHGETLFFSEPLSCFRCHGGFAFTDSRFHDNGLGNFKTPTLRNLAVTAPYMHDGRFATLGEVLDHYASGHPASNELLRGFPLTPQDKADLIEFLKSLTDEDILHDPRFSNPW